jgi:hypothetical protein
VSVTLADLRSRVLEKAEMVSGTFIGGVVGGGTELRSLINDAGVELHNILGSKNQDYFTNPSATTFTLTGSANLYALPSDYKSMRGLDYQVSGNDWTEVRRFQWEERERWSDSSGVAAWNATPRRYTVMSNTVYMVPVNGCSGNYRFWYRPRYTRLVAETDAIPSVMEEYDEYLVLHAAIRCADKDQMDTSSFQAELARIAARIDVEMSNADSSEPEMLSEVVPIESALNDWRF